MRLLTHNMLTSKCMKGVAQGYPLGIQPIKMKATLVRAKAVCKWGARGAPERQVEVSSVPEIGTSMKAQAREVKVTESDFNMEFVSRVIPKLDYDTLWIAADGLGYSTDLPKKLVENYENNEDFLKKIHHVLLEIEVLEGDLICPETGRKFPINSGIPNMLLNEDEVKY